MANQLAILNPSPERQQGPALLHQLVRQDIHDEALAIDFSGPDGQRTSYSYTQLHQNSNRLANHLSSIKTTLPPSTRFIVPLYIPQCPELYISQLAILKAGGAFCPIPLDVPAERLRFILQDAEAQVMVTTKDYRDRLPQLPDIVIVVVDEFDDVPFDSSSPPEISTQASDPAYVMYTSGSTGQPKGVLLSHDAGTQALLAHERHIPQFSRFLQFASPTFDVSVFEIFFPMFRGATLVVCDRKRLLDDLPGTINALEIDAAELTPSVASSLLRGRQSVPNLRVLLTIGEMLKRPIVEDFGGSEDTPSLLQGMYGPTEATIHCTLQPNFTKDMSVNNIGIPLDTVSAFIVRAKSEDDPQNSGIELLQIGEEGELAVGGYQLADGYLKRKEQTDAAFVYHSEYGRLYRTGDKARMDSDGRIYCLGRISSGQVKLRGQRIELGEIEYAALRTPGCRDVVADVIESNTLVTFCVRDDDAASEEDVRRTCREWMPAYMVPQEVLMLDSLPYLASGKINRNALRDIFLRNRRPPSSAAEPKTPQQKQLVDTIGNVLGADVGIDTSLAAAGVDSLRAIRIVSQLRQLDYGQLSAVDILEARSVVELDERINTIKASDSSSPDSPVSSINEELIEQLREHPLVQSNAEDLQRAFPCTAAQVAMLSQTARDPKAYCNWIKLAVDANCGPQVERALHAVASRHEMLRSGFVSLDRSDITHAAVVWKNLSNAQVRTVDQIDPEFGLRTERDFLRPCIFSIETLSEGVQVLLQIHHSLYDQWSIDVLRNDLANSLAGAELQPASSFNHVSEHHRNHLGSNSTSASEDFWEDHLRGCAATSIPLMRGDRVEPSLARTTWQPLDLGQSLQKDSVKDLGVSTHVIFQAAMAYMLSTYVGSTDVTYGTVFSGRHLPVAGIEEVFGPCLTTLPSRVDLASCRTAKDLLQTLHERSRAMLKHSLTPPATVKKASGLAPGATLFDSLFVWQESTVTNEDNETVREVDSADNHEFSLVLEFEPNGSGVRARATYQQSLLTGAQLDLLLKQVGNVVKCILGSPDGLISELSSSLPESLLSTSNPMPSACPDERGIVGAIQDNARSYPQRAALVFVNSIEGDNAETETLSYERLDEQSSRLAATITGLGVTPGDLVCICMEKSVNLYVSILATLKAGAGYLPLTPETPLARCSAILGQTTVKLCICDHDRVEGFRSIKSSQVFDVNRDQWAQKASSHTSVPCRGSNVAYTVFTSGSTGTPKGVAVTYDNLLGNLVALSEIYPAEGGDRMLQACSQAFDVSVFEIFFTFYKGMTLCTATRDTLFADLEAGIRALDVTHLSMTPTVAGLVRPEQVPKVRFLVTAGEAMTDLVHQRWSGKGLYQGYGPSETTNICSVLPQMQHNHHLGNVGPPFRNTSTFVVPPGNNLDILPSGAFGELVYGGQQVFPGYIGNEQLNSKKLVDHPTYGRLYRSGDMGRLLPNGSILIGGRLDDQVKIRGNRVELGEITSVLMRDAAVLDALASVITTEASGQQLVAFWVPKEAQASKFGVVDPQHASAQHTAALYQALEASMTAYMIPSVVLPVTAMPRTSQGKIDRRALEAAAKNLDEASRQAFSRVVEDDSSEDDGVEWSETEKMLAEAFCKSFKLPPSALKRTSSFFALGLDSLNAIAFTRAVQAKTTTSASIGLVLKNPSIARLARALSDAKPSASASQQLERVRNVFPAEFVQRVKRELQEQGQIVEAVLPCTPLQEAMLSSSASASASAYSNLTVLRVNCDMQTMKRCWEQLVARQGILRTRFVETMLPDHPYAQVKVGGVQLPWKESEAQTDSIEAVVEAALNKTRLENVTAAQPLRLVAVDSPVGQYLLLQMHHAIYDGVSMSILMDEIEHLARGQKLPSLVSSEPFLEEMLAHTEPSALNFWSIAVKNFRPKPFPKPSEAPQAKDHVRTLTLQTSGQEVSAFCKRHSVTALSIFQAALAKTLSHCQSIPDICFGNVVSGRTVPIPDVDRLAAPCFNTLPVRVDTATQRSNLDLVRSLQVHNAQSAPYQLTPLRRIQRLSASPQQGLFDLLLLVQPLSEPLDESVWGLVEDRGAMDLPVVLEIVPENEGFRAFVHWQSSRVSAEATELLIATFEASLEACLRFPSSTIAHVEAEGAGILAPEEGVIKGLTNGEESAEPGADAAGEWTEEEKTIREVFVKMSGIQASRIGKGTSLYSLGLDSLNAVQVASQLRKRGLRVSAADVMEFQTVAGLVGMLPSAGAGQEGKQQNRSSSISFDDFDKQYRQADCERYGLASSDVEAIRPCTQVQSGMLAQSLHSQGQLYVNHVSFRVPPGVASTDVEQAWHAVQEKHQLLRAGFHQTEDARYPFAVVIYKTSSAVSPMMKDNFQAIEDAETAASKSISAGLHSLAWQVSVVEASGQKTMTISMHHALYDADSLQVVLTDFSRVLGSRTLEAGLDVDTLLQSVLQETESCRQNSQEFWKDAASNASVTTFPNLTPTVVSISEQQSVQQHSTITADSLRKFAAQQSTTIQALGQSAWGTLIAAYVGEPVVTFGTVLSCRSDPNHEGVVFPAITTLPVSCNTERPKPELLADMTKYNVGLQRHRCMPLAEIQRLAGVDDRALFDSVFVLQTSSAGHNDGLQWEMVRETAGVDYAVSFELEMLGDGALNLRLTFDTAKVSVDHATLMVRQYEEVLLGLVRGESALEMSRELLSITPAEEPTIPSDVLLLHEFVEVAARTCPEKIALEFVDGYEGASVDSRSWSFGEFNARCDQVANLLVRSGVSPGDIVAVCMDKCPEASMAFVGILKAGCSFLAIDPELPSARRQFILQDSGSRVIFLDRKDDELERADVPTQTIILTEKLIEAQASTPVKDITVKPEYTCYCLYTSGTTGNPKGCEITHENAVQATLAFQRLFAGRWDASSRWLQFASYWFDVSILEQFWSWGVGISVVAAPRDLVLEDLTGFIRALNITHIDLTPSLARLVHPDEVPSLCGGVFITGGEALKQEIINAWGPERTICNGYGPTEATIGVTMNTFVGPDAKPSNIGPAFDNVGSYVLVPGTDEPVMRGALGELCVSGKLVGKGYLNRPELTAKAFPLLERFGEKVYRTGDLVRLLADGSFAFAGRKDTQAKLRGQRLELAEIDAVIKEALDGKGDAATLVHKTANGSKELLVGFLSTGTEAKRPAEIDTSDAGVKLVVAARDACSRHLPGYMVPSHILPISKLPLTVNNKVDTKKLVALYEETSSKWLQSLQQSNTETKLTFEGESVVDVLVKLLNVPHEDIDGTSNLFSLGLSSVSAISFASLLKKSGFTKANVATIMKHPTLNHLAQALSQGADASAHDNSAVKQAQLMISATTQRYRSLAAKRLAVQASEIEVVAPCTPLQQGLLYQSQNSSDGAYFNVFQYELQGADLGRLKVAFDRVLQGVQPLRTAFVQTDEGYVQAVAKTRALPWSECNVNGNDYNATAADNRARWLKANQGDVSRPFELCLFQTMDATRLTIHVHHALYDGIAWDLLMIRVAQAYSTGEPVDCGPSFIDALPYGPLNEQKDAKNFWTQTLGSSSGHGLQSTSGNEGKVSQAHATIAGSVAAEDTRRLMGVSHQAIVQACFAVALSQLSEDSRAFGLVVSGRSIEFEGADRVIGPLFNTLPCPISVSDNSSWGAFVRYYQDFNTAAMPYQHTPLRNIRKWTSRSPDDPMFDALLVFQHETEQLTDTKGVRWHEIESEPSADYPLALEVILNADGSFSIMAVAQGAFVDQIMLETFLEHYQEAYKLATQQPSDPIAKSFTMPSSGQATPSNNGPTSYDHLNGVEHFDWTEDARALQRTIAALLGTEPQAVDEHSSLFSLGLDSIDAVKLASRLKKVDINLPVSELLRAQTIPHMLQAAQANGRSADGSAGAQKLAALEEQLGDHFKGSSVSDQFGDVERVLPATPIQESLIAKMLESDFEEYYNHDILRLETHVDIERLKAAWQSVVDQSPILRTSFVEVDSSAIQAVFAQIVHSPTELGFKDLQFSSLDALQDHLPAIAEDVRDTYETQAPLRLNFAHIDGSTYLVLSISHAQYDGHSLALIHQDVQRAYNDTFQSRPSNDTIIEASLQANSQDALDFWRDSLSGCRSSQFPRNETTATRTIRSEMASKTTALSAQEFCQQRGVSLQGLAQMCWALTLAYYTKSLEVVYGVVLACRDSEESEQVLFPTMNTVPIRAALHGSREQMLQHMQSSITDMLSFQRTPLRVIQSIPEVAKQAAGGLFESLFIYQHRPEGDNDDKEQPLYISIQGASDTEYSVAVELEAVGGAIVLRTACKDNVFDDEGTQGLLKTYDAVLNSVLQHPGQPTVSFGGEGASICGLGYIKTEPDEHALPNGTGAEASCSTSAFESSPVPEELCRALAEVSKTNLEDIDGSSTIQSIGIDSISAIKVVSILRKQSIPISVRDILRADNVGSIADLAASNRASKPGKGESSEQIVAGLLKRHGLTHVAETAGVKHQDVEQMLPATAGQVYMLRMWQESQGQLFYPTFSYQLKGTASLGDLRKGWNRLVYQHEVLRTVFCATSNSALPFLQVVLRNAPDAFSEGKPPVVGVPQTKHPMAHLYAERTDGANWTLRLQIHHALYDAVSLPILTNDLATLIAGQTLQSCDLKHTDYLALSSGTQAKQSRERFWTNYLRSAKPLQLPQPSSAGVQERAELFNPSLFSSTKSLDQAARDNGLNPQVLLFAAFARTYAHLAIGDASHQYEKGDVILGLYLSNRSHLPSLDSLATPTLNLVPLLVKAPLQIPILESAQQIQKDLREISTAENAAVGLWEIAQWTNGKVQVDAFVNWIKVPDKPDESSNGGITIAPTAETKESFSRLAQPHQGSESFKAPLELRSLSGEDSLQRAYKYSLDLEATVTSAGALDVGVFAPAGMIGGLEGAERMLGELRREMEGLCG